MNCSSLSLSRRHLQFQAPETSVEENPLPRLHDLTAKLPPPPPLLPRSPYAPSAQERVKVECLMTTQEPELEACLHRSSSSALEHALQTASHKHVKGCASDLHMLFHIRSCWPRDDTSSAKLALPPAFSSWVSVIYCTVLAHNCSCCPPAGATGNSQIILIPIPRVWRHNFEARLRRASGTPVSELPRNGGTESKGLQGHDRTLCER